MEHYFGAPRTKTEVISNPDKQETVFVKTEDFSGLLDLTASLRATEEERGKSKDDMQLVAYLPGIVIEHWCTVNNVTWEEFFKDQKYMKRLLNSPEFAYFKTGSGQI